MPGGATVNSNQISAPVWAGDFFSREHVLAMPGRIDPYSFTDGAGVVVKINNGAGYAADVETITVDALSGPIPKDAIIPIGDAADKKFIRLSAAAAEGATSLSIYPLVTALVDNDEGVYSAFGRKTIPSGTLVGRTLAEAAAKSAFGPAEATDDEIYLTVYDIPNAIENPDCEFYRPGSLVKVNFLPDYTDLSSLVSAGAAATLDVAAGGFLPDATYHVGYTFVDKFGNESAVSADASQATSGSDNSVKVTMPQLPDWAVAYNVYIGTAYASMRLSEANLKTPIVVIESLPSTSLPVAPTTGKLTKGLSLIQNIYQCIIGQK